MSDPKGKKQLISTDEVAKMLGMGASNEAPTTAPTAQDHSNLSVPGNLPVKDLPVVVETHTPKDPISAHKHEESHTEPEEQLAQQAFALKAIKTAAPYLAIFVLGIFLYVFFFTQVDLSGLFRTQAKVKTPQQSALEQLQKQGLDGYNKWIAQFYYDVSDAKVLDPNVDNSGNGLTNFQKYLLNLNPKSYDTLGLGMADSEALAKGINPLTGNNLTDAQKQIVEKYFDLEVAMNRLALAHLQNQAPTQIAGANTYANPPVVSGQPQNNTVVTPSSADSLDIDANVPGRLEIPSLKVSAPIIWTTDPKNFDADLRSGVVHYPGTAMPGQVGTSYISGHSSNYAWAKGDYNHVFTQLGDLAKDASFKITVTLKGGKQATLYYVVTGSQQYTPKDQAQFVNTGKSTVALSTCWPVGSTAKRLVVTGELTQVQK